MDYSHIFVCVMGMGTVFFGLICLIVLTTVMGRLCQGRKGAVPEAPAPALEAPEPDRQQLAAAISAALAEELGTDITGIRILSMKKL
nr:OadG family protein [uncultured Dysosmobacter sp.]